MAKPSTKPDTHYMHDIFLKIEKFLESNQRNLWIENRLFKIYVRKSIRKIEGKVSNFLDLASFEIKIEDKKGIGNFTYLLTLIEDKIKYNIYVESILNERLYGFLEKRNYKYFLEQNMYRLIN